jgi:flagellar basal-body rod protein FlgG
MAVSALESASTGLRALSTDIDVIANNLANVNTTGFRRSRVNFEDLVYQQLAQAGIKNSEDTIKPSGIYIGLGTRVSNTQTLFDAGSLDSTGGQLDLAIDGNGFFQVKIPPTYGTETAYTRAGNLSMTATGQLVSGASDGFLIQPPVTIPNNATNIDIGTDGRVFVTTPTSVSPVEVGQIQLASFINQGGLKPIGSTMFIETDASGPPTVGTPTTQGFGRVLQKFLEASNVDPVRELVNLIQAQRSFEMNSQAIQTADQMLQVIGNLKK